MRRAVGSGCDGSAVTFFLVPVPRLVQRQTFAMGPTTVLFLLLMLGVSEAKRTAGKTSSALVLGVVREGEKRKKKTLLGVCIGSWNCARW